MPATKPAPVPIVVDSVTTLIGLLDSPADLPIDSLGRLGSISLIPLYVAPQIKTYVIDVHLLYSEAFSTSSSNSELSLKKVLESPNIPKVFFDCRNDSDALGSHFEISLDGIIDLQLLELAARCYPRDYVAGLNKCVQTVSSVPDVTKSAWQETKITVGRLYDPKRGSSYEHFNERPLRSDILRYCARFVGPSRMLTCGFEYNAP